MPAPNSVPKISAAPSTTTGVTSKRVLVASRDGGFVVRQPFTDDMAAVREALEALEKASSVGAETEAELQPAARQLVDDRRLMGHPQCLVFAEQQRRLADADMTGRSGDAASHRKIAERALLRVPNVQV